MIPAGTGPYLALYGVTLLVHAVLVSYVLLGAGWLAARGLAGRPDDAVAARFRDLLPFALGLAITAGVAPLLFLQLLHQHRFYTANLLLGPRWMAVVPALIVGFYALYLAKSERAAAWSPRWRAAIPTVAAACFVFVAWSWTENHLLSLRDDRWPAMYGEGARLHVEPALAPRLALWLALALPVGATLAAWLAGGDRAALRALRPVALAGTAGAAACAAWLATTMPPLPGGPALAAVLGACAAGFAAAWLGVPAGRRLPLLAATVLLAVALVAGVVAREAIRLEAVGLAPLRPRVAAAGGMLVFAVCFVGNAALIAYLVASARRHLR